MKRRSLLKSLGAVAAAPFLPAIPAVASASTVAASAVDARTYKWAEMIVRAHNKCSPAMLERLIGLSPAKAAALQAEFMSKGVIGAQSQFGIHQATKPLWEGAFPKPHIRTKQAIQTVKDLVTEISEPAKSEAETEQMPVGQALEQPEDETATKNAVTTNGDDDVALDLKPASGQHA